METKIREVAPDLYQLYLPLPMRPSIVNVYLLRSGEEWTLFDTGISSEESLAAFQAALDAVGCPPTAIRKLIATHHHPDHFGASRRQKELTGAEIYFHPLKKSINSGSPEPFDMLRINYAKRSRRVAKSFFRYSATDSVARFSSLLPVRPHAVGELAED